MSKKKTKNGGGKKPHKRTAVSKARTSKRRTKKKARGKKLGAGPKRGSRSRSKPAKTVKSVKPRKEVRGHQTAVSVAEDLFETANPDGPGGGRVGPSEGFDRQVDPPETSAQSEVVTDRMEIASAMTDTIPGAAEPEESAAAEQPAGATDPDIDSSSGGGEA